MRAHESPGQPENDNLENAVDEAFRLIDSLADVDDMTKDEARLFFGELIRGLEIRKDAL